MADQVSKLHNRTKPHFVSKQKKSCEIVALGKYLCKSWPAVLEFVELFIALMIFIAFL